VSYVDSVSRGVGDSGTRSTLGNVGQDDESPWVIEMFVDDVSGIGLWDRSGGPPDWEMTEDVSEDNLPMPDDLRQRIKTWVNEYTESITDPVVRRRWTMEHEVAHDVRGYELSRELQRVLGPTFRIDYKFHTQQGRKSVRDSA
jgi:hypothetical protein